MRKRLGTQRTRTINKIKHILRKHNLEQECPTKKFQTQKVRRWLTEIDLPALDRLEVNLRKTDEPMGTSELIKLNTAALGEFISFYGNDSRHLPAVEAFRAMIRRHT